MKKKMGMGGMHMMPDGSMMQNSMMKKGGTAKSSKQQAAIAIAMKASGKKPKMAMGGTLKDVPSDKVGLSKLPTAVRNKMGFKKMGGPSEMKCGGMMKKGGSVGKSKKC